MEPKTVHDEIKNRVFYKFCMDLIAGCPAGHLAEEGAGAGHGALFSPCCLTGVESSRPEQLSREQS